MDILICVESWCTKDDKEFDIPKYPGFVMYRKDRDYASGGGILIFVRKHIAFVEINNLKIPDQTVELCALNITNVNPQINILICYRAPGDLSQAQWDTIFENVNNNDCWLIVGDFNAHNTDWNCLYTNTNGRKLGRTLSQNNLFLHNNDSKTHVDIRTNSYSNIDLAISTLNIADKISVEACDETWGSDHFPLLINLDLCKNSYEKKTFKLKSLNTNWSGVNESLENSYEKFLSLDYENLSIVEKYNFFVETVSDAVRHHTPRKSFSGKNKNPVPWWDEECNKIIRLRKAFFKKWQYSGDLFDLIQYKKKVRGSQKNI